MAYASVVVLSIRALVETEKIQEQLNRVVRETCHPKEGARDVMKDGEGRVDIVAES